MTDSDSPSVSRRGFLGACGAIGVTATMSAPTIGQAAREQFDPLAGISPDLSGISSEGRASIRTVDRRFQQQRPEMKQTVHAVKNLGLDPTGKEPVNGKLSKISSMSNTRVMFPSDGTFALSEQVTLQPDGPIEFVGNGCSFTIPSGEEMKSMIFVLPSGSLIDNIVIDQSAKGAVQEFGVQTNGVVRADNVTIKGYAPAKKNVGPTGSNSKVDGMLSPMAKTENGVVRMTDFTAVGGTAAGTHDEADLPDSAPENRLGAPMGIWVGQTNKGTVQMLNPKLSGWSNGMYAGRTKGTVEVRGGKFVNNFNCQTRFGGTSVVDGASMLLDDRIWSDKGPFKIGHQGVYAVRVDAKHGNLIDPVIFKNLKIVANSMREGASLFDWESKSGPGIIRNCHITNHLDRPVIIGESPSAPAATNILVDNCLIDGKSSAGVMEIHDRPQSRIQRTCIQLPGAGPDDINGAQIGKAVSFGKQCESGSGLKNPGKVGDGGNLSKLPVPDNPSPGTPVPETPDFSEKNPGIADGIANWFEDTVQAFENTILGFGKMFVLIIASPLIILTVIALLLFGVLLVVLLFLVAGLKALKE